jgi:hypothetical protein
MNLFTPLLRPSTLPISHPKSLPTPASPPSPKRARRPSTSSRSDTLFYLHLFYNLLQPRHAIGLKPSEHTPARHLLLLANTPSPSHLPLQCTLSSNDQTLPSTRTSLSSTRHFHLSSPSPPHPSRPPSLLLNCPRTREALLDLILASDLNFLNSIPHHFMPTLVLHVNLCPSSSSARPRPELNPHPWLRGSSPQSDSLLLLLPPAHLKRESRDSYADHR